MNRLIFSILIIIFLTSYVFTLGENIVLASSFIEGLQTTGGAIGYDTTANAKDNALPKLAGQIIGALLAFIGVIFLALAIYGGYTWMMARGNEQEISKAKNVIKNALIGIVIVLMAYAITTIVRTIWLQV